MSLPSSPITEDAGLPEPALENEITPPVFLLAGYSYGAMITKLLPPLESIIQPFATPKNASAAADIRLRAQHLAEQQNVVLASSRAALAESHRGRALGRKSMGVRVGGDEDKRRSQDHSRRSFSIDAEEKIRKGVADLLSRAKSHHRKHHHQKHMKGDGDENVASTVAKEGIEDPEHLPPAVGVVRPRVAYLLVSPPVGWATNLMTMNLTVAMSGWFGKMSHKSPKSKEGAGRSSSRGEKETHHEQQLAEQKLVEYPTLAVYGDSDVFVAVKKFRDWASRLQSVSQSEFRAHEISTAGHFYIEEGVAYRLRDAVKAFAEELLQ